MNIKTAVLILIAFLMSSSLEESGWAKAVGSWNPRGGLMWKEELGKYSLLSGKRTECEHHDWKWYLSPTGNWKPILYPNMGMSRFSRPQLIVFQESPSLRVCVEYL